MRKRITKILLAAVALCSAVTASAYDFVSDGMYYNILSTTGKTVEVTWGDDMYEGDIAIPSTVQNEDITYSVTTIGEEAFYAGYITSVTIPNSVTSIGSKAFSSCIDLTSVAIGDGVKKIGSSAFEDCSSLTSVIIPESVTSIGSYAFYRCSSLTSVTIHGRVTEISFNVFSGCSSLTSVTILQLQQPYVGNNP